MSEPVLAPGALIQTKLRVPRARPGLVARPRLTARLDEIQWRKLALICAPPGAGKTTALAEWAAGKDLPIAWLSLDETDNLLEGFLTYLVAALQKLVPGCGAAALTALNTPQPVAVEPFTTRLINDLDAATGPLVLVLDDFHLIHNPEAQAVVAMLVGHLPASLHLVLASRSDPPLPLARLRASGELLELRGADLRFTPQEAADFLERAVGLELEPEDIAALEERTEGWIAGLQLAALSLRGRKDAAAFIQAFTGSNRYVLDYLLEEVLLRQPPEVQSFLLQTSILERLSAPLCDALLEPPAEAGGEAPTLQRASSQRALEHLERANLFVEALDDERRWFRYHRLFGDLLRFRLEGSYPPAEVHALHRRAAAWLAEAGLPIAAVAHYCSAGEFAKAGWLVHRHGAEMLNRGDANRLLSWIEILPDGLRQSFPYIEVLTALGLISTGQYTRVAPHLAAAEERIRALQQSNAIPPDEVRQLETDIATSRALIASTQGDLEATIRLGNQAMAVMPTEAPLRGVIAMGMAIAYRMQGYVNLADQYFLEAFDFCAKNNQEAVALTALCNHGDVQIECGRLHPAFETYQQVLDLATSPEGQISPIASLAHVGLAVLNYEWDELDFAREHCQLAETLGESWGNNDVRAAGIVLQARAHQARGEGQAALSALELAGSIQVNPLIQSVIAANRLQIWLQAGRLEWALRWMEQHPFDFDAVPFTAEVEATARAQVLIAQRDPQKLPRVLALLERLLATAGEQGRDGRRVEILTVQALAYSALRENGAALDTLARAREIAQPQGYVRAFVDKGPAMLALLRQLSPSGAMAAYAGRLVTAFGASIAAVPAGAATTPAFGGLYATETFSSRELEVLHLVAAGLSNAVIAERLTITQGTVKRHLHNIFGKLGAANRTEAVAIARRLELM